MKRIITNWENDIIETPEEQVTKFVSERYSNYDFKLLSGLRHRNIEDIYDSLRDSRVIIMQPFLLEKEQISKIVAAISHPIHVNNNGARREWEIRDFIFLSSQPFEDLKTIKNACLELKDNVKEEALPKIIHNCEIHFHGFDGEHYEMKCHGYSSYDIIAIRHK